ncbi:MAG: DtxR family transcriptional regulator [Phycisphaerae bacterium]
MTEATDVQLSASLEDYIEAIYRIVQDKSAARAKDISERLAVSRSSVTGALHALADRGLINYAPYDVITLTETGQAVAEDVVRRHEVLRDFFVKVLAIDPAEADGAACKMEHAIPETILERFLEFVEFVERCPHGLSDWIQDFGYSCHQHSGSGTCSRCETPHPIPERTNTMDETAETQTRWTLAQLKPGEKATIVKIAGSGGVRRRLLDMGATAGTVVEIERKAPLGDPIQVKIKGYHLTLRKEEAERITVEALG